MNVLENILVKLQIWIRMLSFKHSQLQLMHSCITTSRGLSQMARKKRMFFRTFFTWNNTFFATLVHQATKGKSTWAVLRTSFTAVCSCIISSELHKSSLYKYKHIARQILQELTHKNSILSFT